MKKTLIATFAAGLLAVLSACGGGDAAADKTFRVGTLSDAPPNIYVENGNYTGYAPALAALKSGAVDAYILDQTIAETNVKESTDTKLKVVKSFTTDVPHGFAVKKGNTELLTKINEGLKQVIADGTWVSLHQRFLPTAPVPAEFKAGQR